MGRIKVIETLPRFLAKVVVNEKTGCWDWTAGRFRRGYGAFNATGKMERAHRVSYKLHCDQIPEGVHVLHRCDNRLCVNPEHLFLGTNADNMADKNAKGRQARGIGHGSVKLAEDDVIAIRSVRGVSQRDLAERYGVCQAQISAIRTGRCWEHLLENDYFKPKGE